MPFLYIYIYNHKQTPFNFGSPHDALHLPSIEGECKIVGEIGLVLNESVIWLYYECIRPLTWLCHACECKEIKIENDRYSPFDLIVESQQRAEISFEKFYIVGIR